MRRLLATSLPAGLALLASAGSAHADGKATCVAAANEANVQRQSDPTKLLDLRKKLLTCAADECPAAVRDECREQLAAVEGELPSVVLVAEDGGGHALLDVRVSLDGVLLAERLDGLPVALDPGAHELVFERAEAPPVRVTTIARAGQKSQPVIARFEVEGSPAPPTPRDAAPEPPPGEGPRRPLRMVGLGVGALGVIGLGVAGVFGLRAISKQSDADCMNNLCATPDKLSAHRDAQNAADVSTGFAIAGGVLTAAGLALFFLAPTSRPAGTNAAGLRPVVGPTAVGVTYNGVFFR